MSAFTLSIAPTFERDYRKAGVQLQHLVEGAVKDLIRRATADPGGWRRLYDRVAGLKRTVLEIDLAGGPRMLALDEDDEVVLWRMGDHSLIDRLGAKPTYPSERLPLPDHFRPERHIRLFPPDAGDVYVDYANERTADWIYWLDEEQQLLAEGIHERVVDAYLDGTRTIEPIFGGPGTGKTTILVWLLKQLAVVEADGEQLDVAIAAPASVLNQIENTTGWDLAPLHVSSRLIDLLNDSDSDRGAPDVVLVDDPAGLADVAALVKRYPGASVVFGFDPLQLAESITDDELASWLSAHNCHEAWLTTCFRQKEVVGAAAKQVADVVSASSPFLAADKISRYRSERSSITERANGMRFVNPSGVVRTYEDPTIEQWDAYWQALYSLRRQGRLWDHWPPLVVVRDPAADIDERWLMRIDAVASHRRTVDQIEMLKGLEYQHVLLLLSRPLYDALDRGFEGSGQAKYNRYRLLRIPFSRAKDSAVTFVFPTVGAEQANG